MFREILASTLLVCGLGLLVFALAVPDQGVLFLPMAVGELTLGAWLTLIQPKKRE
jgi:hypothetical protein